MRSFADGDGDGVGDIAGLEARIPHLVDLGVDAVWINPWYPSPLADGGYDISDHRAVDPTFGTVADAERLVGALHRAGLRVLLDIVPNHTSSTHPWFRAAVADGPGSASRERFVFRTGRGVHGELPPNNWRSQFGGSAWTRIVEPDGRLGQWYLHLFAPQQPDLNWHHLDVRVDFDATLRFWFDRGVDGFRVDVAHGLFKDSGLRDVEDSRDAAHPHWDREEVHEVYRSWRRVADAYDPPRVFLGEVVTGTPSRTARYVRDDELHMAFNFDFLEAPWRADDLRAAIISTLGSLAEVGAPATWVLSNHDVMRHASRMARDQDLVDGHNLVDLLDLPSDPELGWRRARAAVLLLLGLPGVACVYQGEELGLPEVEDLPADVLLDPSWERSGGTDPGRDGCRVPIPWSGDRTPFGFSQEGVPPPPLPQPSWWRSLTVQAQRCDPSSMLSLYTAALRIRRAHPALGDGDLEWMAEAPPDVVDFRRPPGLRVVVNLGATPVALPDGRPVLASCPLDADGRLPSDAAAWLECDDAPVSDGQVPNEDA